MMRNLANVAAAALVYFGLALVMSVPAAPIYPDAEPVVWWQLAAVMLLGLIMTLAGYWLACEAR